MRDLTLGLTTMAAEHRADQVPEAGDEGRDGREVRAGVAAQRNEGDVFAACAFDGSAGDDAARIGQQHDLEQHGRRVGAGAALVVVEAGIEAAQVDLVIDQVVQRVLQGPRQQLGLEVHREKPRAGVDVLVAGHRGDRSKQITWACNSRARTADSGDGFSTASLEGMQLEPRHTTIIEAIETPWGTLVREDYFQYPEKESNLYMVDGTGNPLWFAERAMEDDAYANAVRRVGQDRICCASWNGFDCEINLIDGKLVNAKLTK